MWPVFGAQVVLSTGKSIPVRSTNQDHPPLEAINFGHLEGKNKWLREWLKLPTTYKSRDDPSRSHLFFFSYVNFWVPQKFSFRNKQPSAKWKGIVWWMFCSLRYHCLYSRRKNMALNNPVAHVYQSDLTKWLSHVESVQATSPPLAPVTGILGWGSRSKGSL